MTGFIVENYMLYIIGVKLTKMQLIFTIKEGAKFNFVPSIFMSST